jgi:DNA-binding MarR family transcriptional regulator
VHLDEAGMRRAHYALLVALREDGPASQAALGRRLAADRSDMHRTVGELESRGLIAREPDPGDRRRNLVTLTGAGVAALRGADALVDAAQAELLVPLRAAERDVLVRLLSRVLQRP